MAKQSGSSKYCLDCRYCLDHLENNECPECGRVFDPDQPKSFSNTQSQPCFPRWELGIAFGLFLIFFIQSRGWLTVRYRYSRISWAHDYGWELTRFDNLFWTAPFVCLVPVFIISAFRAKMNSKLNVGLCVLMFVIYLLLPQTREWFLDIGQVVSEIHRIDAHLESRSGQ
jgi:hypothetical protein